MDLFTTNTIWKCKNSTLALLFVIFPRITFFLITAFWYSCIVYFFLWFLIERCKVNLLKLLSSLRKNTVSVKRGNIFLRRIKNLTSTALTLYLFIEVEDSCQPHKIVRKQDFFCFIYHFLECRLFLQKQKWNNNWIIDVLSHSCGTINYNHAY